MESSWSKEIDSGVVAMVKLKVNLLVEVWSVHLKRNKRKQTCLDQTASTGAGIFELPSPLTFR